MTSGYEYDRDVVQVEAACIARTVLAGRTSNNYLDSEARGRAIQEAVAQHGRTSNHGRQPASWRNRVAWLTCAARSAGLTGSSRTCKASSCSS